MDEADGDETKPAAAELTNEFLERANCCAPPLPTAATAATISAIWLESALAKHTFLCLLRAACVPKWLEQRLQPNWEACGDAELFWLTAVAEARAALLALLRLALLLATAAALPDEEEEEEAAAAPLLPVMCERLWRHKFENCV